MLMKLIHIIFNLLYYIQINRNDTNLFFGAKQKRKDNIQINNNKDVKLFSKERATERAKENTHTIINNTNKKNKTTKIEYILVDDDLHPCFIINF